MNLLTNFDLETISTVYCLLRWFFRCAQRLITFGSFVPMIFTLKQQNSWINDLALFNKENLPRYVIAKCINTYIFCYYSILAVMFLASSETSCNRLFGLFW